MATAYTPNALLRKPATSDRNWDVPLNANADFLDGLSSVGRLLVTPNETPSASLRVRVTGGIFQKSDGTVVAFAGVDSYPLPASSTVRLWLTEAGVLSSGASFPSIAHVRLATVVTGPTAVLSVGDERVVTRSCTGAGGLTLQVNSQTNTLGFFGVTPAAQADAVAVLNDTTSGTASDSVAAVGTTFSPAVIDDNFASLAAKVNELIAVLKRYGLLPN